MKPAHYSIGWDVGGWNCDRNQQSRDAIAIVDADLTLVGTPWRGNLRGLINRAASTREWLEGLFEVCGVEAPAEGCRATLAIDTPLGFSDGFRGLVNNLQPAGPVGDSQANPYLHRETERFLFARGWKPLSPIKDMIGSQATKGMHVLAKFAPQVARCGVWTDGARLEAIEGYPTVARKSVVIRKLRASFPSMPHADIEDALLCALLAHLFSHRPDDLESPGAGIPETEGWIWVPKR